MPELYIGNRTGSGSRKTSISSATVVLAASNFVYDGTTKTQGVSSVTVNGVVLVEGTDYTIRNNSQIDAGDYTLYLDGQGNYKGVKAVSWHIYQTQGSITVNSDVLAIASTAGSTGSITFTKVGDGAVTASSSDNSIATASISGTTVTVTAVSTGIATITVILSPGTDYAGASNTFEVACVSSVLAENTPKAVQIVATENKGSNFWSIGSITAPISIGAVGNMPATSACAFIIGFNHNSSKEGTGIHFQFGKTTAGVDIAFVDSGYSSSKTSGTWFNMNNSDTNSGGWNSSIIRSTICLTFLSALPINWQNVIASTDKYTDNTGGGSSNNVTQTATIDKIWLLSEYEVFGAKSYAASTESSAQVQYDYYKNGNSKIKYRHNATTTACAWWLRSPNYNASGNFCGVKTSGNANSYSASASIGFAPGFRVA